DRLALGIEALLFETPLALSVAALVSRVLERERRHVAREVHHLPVWDRWVEGEDDFDVRLRVSAVHIVFAEVGGGHPLPFEDAPDRKKEVALAGVVRPDERAHRRHVDLQAADRAEVGDGDVRDSRHATSTAAGPRYQRGAG